MPDIIQQLIIKACKDHYQNDHILYLIPQLNVPVKQIDKYQNKTDRSEMGMVWKYMGSDQTAVLSDEADQEPAV